ncbi:MAG TPA: MlaD family protein [Sphingomonadaceae bacterium]|jgi:phospholipid/cholesterol/gamma-HCH transport system substrate-binding protein
METRSNYVWVGAVTLLLLAALAVFIVWLTRLGAADQKEYDIFFDQSVDGLAKGSEVTFSGVPAGQVKKIELWQKNPEFARVRISIDDDIPILVGATAQIQSSFTGVAKIQLDGSRVGAPPITCQTTACPEGKPVIPPKAGGLGQILNSAPVLLDRLATLTERLTELLSDKNQASISGILANTERMTDHLADASPQIDATLKQLQVTLKQADASLAAFEQTMHSTDSLLNKQGEPLAKQLRETMASAKQAADSLRDALNDTRPAAREFSQSTLPAAEATLRDLRATSESLRKITDKINNQGAGGLLGGKNLPEYKP